MACPDDCSIRIKPEKTRPCLPRTAAYRPRFLHWRRPSKRPRGSDESRGRCCVSKNLRGKLFYPKTVSVFVSLPRPQRGRGNLKVEGMASRGEAREHVAKRNTYNKKHGNRCVVLRPLSSFQGYVSLRATIVRYGMTNLIVKDCRVGRKKCALLAMTNLVGFAGKRNKFRNETFEKRCGTTLRKK